MFYKINKEGSNDILIKLELINYLLLNYECENILDSIINSNNIRTFEKDIYRFISNIITNLRNNVYYLLNVNEKFNLNEFINYIKINNKYFYQEFILYGIYKIKIFIYKSNIICLVDDINLFLKLYEKKDFIKTLKDSYKDFDINVLAFSNEKGFDIMYDLTEKHKSLPNLVFIDCLKKINTNMLFKNKIKTNLSNIIFLNFKRKYNNSINPEYVFKIYENIKKLNINTFESINLKECLESKLFSQDEIVNSVIHHMDILNKKRKDKRPIGSWLLCGPSGTGKTELAKVLAYSLFNSMDNLIKIDMSEYMEQHSISKLIGAPPGYAGYDEECFLEKKFKEGSSFVILFDEIEKGHKDFSNSMLQVLDEGRLTLSNGSILNFDQSFIIFTSNLGYSNGLQDGEIDKNFVLNEIKKFFRIEFLNRLNNIFLFNPIDCSNLNKIFSKFIHEYSSKFNFNISVKNILENDLIKYCYNNLYGSRPLRRFTDDLFYKVYYNNYLLSSNNNYNLNYINNFNNCLISFNCDPIVI